LILAFWFSTSKPLIKLISDIITNCSHKSFADMRQGTS
jgi:hypothetical protein